MKTYDIININKQKQVIQMKKKEKKPVEYKKLSFLKFLEKISFFLMIMTFLSYIFLDSFTSIEKEIYSLDELNSTGIFAAGVILLLFWFICYNLKEVKEIVYLEKQNYEEQQRNMRFSKENPVSENASDSE